jgi:hypothetical protein
VFARDPPPNSGVYSIESASTAPGTPRFSGYSSSASCPCNRLRIFLSAPSTASVFAMGAKGLDDYRVPIAWFEGRLSAVPAPIPQARHFFLNALGGLKAWLGTLTSLRKRQRRFRCQRGQASQRRNHAKPHVVPDLSATSQTLSAVSAIERSRSPCRADFCRDGRVG